MRVARDGRRSALVGAPRAETLVDLLRADAHLAPFLAIPAQDNGFDVGGLAVVGDRLYVGLRGPVLRGWAVVLEVRPAQDPTDPGRLALGIFPEGARYRKHVLDLGGLGVRDLCPDGDDLLVLAGPTMALSGPVRVHRWRGAVAGGGGPVVRDAELPVETVVTNGEGVDHASAISLLGPDPLDAARAAAGGLRQPGGGPQAVAGHGARRPRADRASTTALDEPCWTASRRGPRAWRRWTWPSSTPCRPPRSVPRTPRRPPTRPTTPPNDTDRGHHRGHRRRHRGGAARRPARDEPDGPQHAANAPDVPADRAPADHRPATVLRPDGVRPLGS